MEWACSPLGIVLYVNRILYNDGEFVRGVRMFAPGISRPYEGYDLEGYTGKLPYQLKWSDRRADVEKMLGTPGIEDKDSVEYRTSANERLAIYYATDSTEDRPSRIRDVYVFLPVDFVPDYTVP